MKLLSTLFFVAAGLASTVSALASYSPISSGPKYQVGIPSGSSISSSSAGAIYFSLSAPATYQWVGLGIGSAMAGAHIFVIYADGSGNVTVSARDGGQGHIEPQFDSSLFSGIELLEGSGIVSGNMVANIKCTTCTLDSSATSTSSPWICAWMEGSAIDSSSETYTLNQHGPNSMRQFTFDLTQAALSDDSNPFKSSSTSTASGTASGTSSSPSSTSSSDSSSSANSNSNTSTGSATIGPSEQTVSDYKKAHGIIMGTTVVLLFPLGATYMRLYGSATMHSIMQLFSLCALLCGLGVGVKLAQMTDYLYKSTGRTHTIFGTTITALFILQPFFGFFHHYQYKRTGGRTPISHVHIWYGRTIMILAVINGGLGLQLANNTRDGKIIYGTVAGVVGVLYMALVAAKRKNPAPWGFGKSSTRSKEGLREEIGEERIVTPPRQK